jgi:hypothetical protein
MSHVIKQLLLKELNLPRSGLLEHAAPADVGKPHG